MRFTKMHGAGNDYVYIDCLRQPPPHDPAALARQISDRHTGIGSDGLVLICPSPVADARMRMFNADGSEAEMCGNGLRCLGKFLYDRGLASSDLLTVEAGSRVLNLRVRARGRTVDQVRVDLGEPVLKAAHIPTTLPGSPVVDAPLRFGAWELPVTAVSLGNPHCVVFVDQLSDELVHEAGPALERCEYFPQRTNVEFVEVLSRECVRQRTWERGSGETLSCGSGACAVCVAGVLSGRTSRRIAVELRGGELLAEWNADDNHVYLTGPAVEVFSGEWPDEGEKSEVGMQRSEVGI